MKRLNGNILSPNSKYLIFVVKHWDPQTNKTTSNIQYTPIDQEDIKDITLENENYSDSNPFFYDNNIFFIRNGQIFYTKFEQNKNNIKINEEKQLTNFQIPINDFKIKNGYIILSMNLYFYCGNNITCSEEKTSKENNNYYIFDNLFAFHWDTWLREGKGSHLLHIKLNKSNDEYNIESINDITQNMNINTPPLLTSNVNYDIDNSGKKIVFASHDRNHEESWNTGWKIYYYDSEIMSKPLYITTKNLARNQNPKFNKDGTKIAYLAMKTPMLESENLHFEIYNILNNKITVIDNDLDLTINSFIWFSDSEIYFGATTIGLNKLFSLKINNITNYNYSNIQTKSKIHSYDTPFAIKDNKLFVRKNGYNIAERIIYLYKNDTEYEENEILNLNKDLLEKYEFPEPVSFNFTGGYNDTVYGWIFKPINYNKDKKYKTVLLIHGGPESSWSSDWSYRWNPEAFANQGFAVILINIHGSTGVSQKFTDSVRNDWGGVPFYDLITGMKYIVNTYSFVDSKNLFAAGASYGGYMINWIQGHNDDSEIKFKALAAHDGAFSVISKFYSTDELWFQKSEFCPPEKIGCNPFDNKEIRAGFDKNCPEEFVKNWETPMIIMHGGKDYRVPLTEGLGSFTSLKLKGIDSKLVYFPQENHWVLKPENQVIWFNEIINWFNKYVN
jgi:dipeptidyl aminopeptidase/acylaminoacyl peptidase